MVAVIGIALFNIAIGLVSATVTFYPVYPFFSLGRHAATARMSCPPMPQCPAHCMRSVNENGCLQCGPCKQLYTSPLRLNPTGGVPFGNRRQMCPPVPYRCPSSCLVTNNFNCLVCSCGHSYNGGDLSAVSKIPLHRLEDLDEDEDMDYDILLNQDSKNIIAKQKFKKQNYQMSKTKENVEVIPVYTVQNGGRKEIRTHEISIDGSTSSDEDSKHSGKRENLHFDKIHQHAGPSKMGDLCPQIKCPEECSIMLVPNDAGCPTCTCQSTNPECPSMPMCSPGCSVEQDHRGCDVCACGPDARVTNTGKNNFFIDTAKQESQKHASLNIILPPTTPALPKPLQDCPLNIPCDTTNNCRHVFDKKSGCPVSCFCQLINPDFHEELEHTALTSRADDKKRDVFNDEEEEEPLRSEEVEAVATTHEHLPTPESRF